MGERERGTDLASPEALHLVPEPVWRGRDPNAGYTPERFPDEGFIHLTHGDEELLAVANRFYQSDERPYLALTVDLIRAGSPVRYDDPARRYPHVYGPLDPAAVTRERRMLRDERGAFLGFGEG